MPQSTDKLLDAVLARLPGAARAVTGHRELTLGRYAARLTEPGPKPLQSRDDLARTAHDLACDLLGPKTARDLADHLDQGRAVLTANHHGADFHAQSFQGSLAFALPMFADGPRQSCPVVPVLACSMVPLASFSYPRGLMLAHADPRTPDEPAPRLKLPIFPSRLRHALVRACQPFSQSMVRQALAGAGKMTAAGDIAPGQAKAAAQILETVFLDPDVLGRASYSDQATMVQARIWRAATAPCGPDEAPELACLDLEAVCARLLAGDLKNDDSLFSALLLDPGLRGDLLKTLDGIEGCWNLSRLASLGKNHGQGGNEARRGCGTAFFWTLDAKGRRTPLAVERRGGKAVLAGRTLAPNGREGQALEFPLAARELGQALDEGRLIPGLFACYASLALARGVRCCGGVFQSDYLEVMREGLVLVLESRGAGHWARPVSAAPTDGFLAGLETVFVRDKTGRPQPAGPLEMIAAGGLGRDQIMAASRATVMDAALCGAGELYREFIPESEREPGWTNAWASTVLEAAPVVLPLA